MSDFHIFFQFCTGCSGFRRHSRSADATDHCSQGWKLSYEYALSLIVSLKYSHHHKIAEEWLLPDEVRTKRYFGSIIIHEYWYQLGLSAAYGAYTFELGAYMYASLSLMTLPYKMGLLMCNKKGDICVGVIVIRGRRVRMRCPSTVFHSRFAAMADFLNSVIISMLQFSPPLQVKWDK